MHSENMNLVKNIAIVSHDNRKIDLIEWSFNNRHVLGKHQVVAIGNTADILEGTLNVPVLQLAPAIYGGDKELGNLILGGKVDVIIFLVDEHKPQDVDVKWLRRIAEEMNIVVAANEATAEFVLHSTLLNGEETFDIPAYSTRAAV